MRFGKKELIMSALVVSLGAAVYINWQFNENEQNLNVSTDSSEIGAAHYVNASISSSEDSSSKQTSSRSESSQTESKQQENSKTESNAAMENGSRSQTSSMSTTTAQEYFSKVRLERKQTQDELIELAKEIVEAADSSGKGKEAAVKQLSIMSDTIQQQSNIENLIIAKGFDDSVCFIQNGECSVVVTGQELKSDLLIAIKDIVIGQTGISFDKIKVTHI